MADKWKGKYRIPSARAEWWDYGWNSSYFITLCTHHRQHFFGKCADGKMKLTSVGAIVQGFWYEIPRHFEFVILGEFIVMPNHLHGILTIDKPTDNTSWIPTSTRSIVEQRKGNQGKHTVSSIIGSYKSVCSRHIHASFPDINFAWQDLLWDNIIQNEQSFANISNYIRTNPQNWHKDKFFGDVSPLL